MVLVLVVGGLVGWYVRQVRVRRAALATIGAAGGTVSFDDQRPDSTGWRAWLYRWTGDDLLREVNAISFFATPAGGRPAGGLASVPLRPTSDQACAAIARLGRVKRVDLFDRAITAPGLAELASSRVEELRLVGSAELTDAILAQIRRLRRLRTLTINWPKAGMPRATLRAVASLEQLEELGLYGLTDLRSDDLAPLGALRGLRKIGIDAAPGDEACLDHLGAVGRLTSLSFAGTRVTDAGLRRLVARAPRLRSIGLDGPLLTDRGIEALADLPDLEFLNLMSPRPQRTRFSDASLVALGRLGSLKDLFLNGGRFTDVGLDAVRGCPFDRLNLDAIEASEAGIARLLAGRSFTYLGLHGSGVTDAALPHLAGHLTGRSSLDLTRSRVTDAGMPLVAALKLRALVLNATAVTDAGLATLATGTTVRSLLANDTPITPAGAAAFQAARPGTNLYTGPSPPGDN